MNNDITCQDLMAEFILHQSIKNKTNEFLTQENNIIIPECRNFNYYESINKQHINITNHHEKQCDFDTKDIELVIGENPKLYCLDFNMIGCTADKSDKLRLALWLEGFLF